MGLFGKKKSGKAEERRTQMGQEESQYQKEQTKAAAEERQKASAEQKQPQIKEYIRGAGGTIVTKSILSGTSRLKWIFRQEIGEGNGWVAFGDTDSQEYVNDAKNMEIVDFNVLANIEPAVVNIFYMPMGSDLEFRSDETGKYFVDTRTGQEIREPVKHPGQIAFEKNLKFLNRESYPLEFFQGLFTTNGKTEVVRAGEADLPTGEIVLADPLAYLGSKYETVLDRKVPAGSYPVELSVCRSRIVGLRYAAARLLIGTKPAVRYEIAMPKGEVEKSGNFTFFGVDTGLACIADAQTAQENRAFFEKWERENPGKNKYTDYFAAFFQKSYEARPEFQNRGGSCIEWRLPESGQRVVMFASGMGDGIFSGYWGMDEDGGIACLVVPFMNPEFF
ncbi:MAG: DUF2185 domain-containing protein [Lachnospiraceae bacterium]|nr:DUF2185 domain-containing protein [Butyrivibrio sp.]MCM1344739.1 DUF2185 domain-containing protein [Muribaculaceae bacterium]MCM1409101.1 DUF2185 domain-containing protein [Lachnospiraceae bacterium]